MDATVLVAIAVSGSVLVLVAVAACAFLQCYVHKRHAPIKNSVKVKYIPDEVIEKIELGEVFVEKAKETKKDKVKRLRERMMNDKTSNTNAKLLDVVKTTTYHVDHEVLPSAATLSTAGSEADQQPIPTDTIAGAAAAAIEALSAQNHPALKIATAKNKPMMKASSPSKRSAAKRSFGSINIGDAIRRSFRNSFADSFRRSFGRISASRNSFGASFGETDDLMKIRERVIENFIMKEKKDAAEEGSIKRDSTKSSKVVARLQSGRNAKKENKSFGWFGLRSLFISKTKKMEKQALKKKIIKKNVKISGEAICAPSVVLNGTDLETPKKNAADIPAVELVANSQDVKNQSTKAKRRKGDGNVVESGPGPVSMDNSGKDDNFISMLDDLVIFEPSVDNLDPETDSMATSLSSDGSALPKKNKKKKKEVNTRKRRGGVSDKGELSLESLFPTDKDDDDDDDDDIVAEANEYERNGEDMSHLIHKRRLLRDGCDLFDLDRTERRRELLAWRGSMRAKLKQRAAENGEIDVLAVNAGPPHSAIRNGYKLAEVLPIALDDSLCRRKIMYLIDDNFNNVHGWFYGSIAIRSKKPGCNYKVKYDKGFTNTRHVDGIVDTLLSFQGEEAYGRRWVLLDRLDNDVPEDTDEGVPK